MAALIYNLKSRQPVEDHGGRDWSAQESAELYRVAHLLNEAGMSVALHIGRSDEGDPWAVFERRETAEVLVHVARSHDLLIVVNLQTRQTYRGREFRASTNQTLRDAPLSIQQARNTGKVILHPSAIFSAFLVAAIASNVLLHTTQAAKASDEVKVANNLAGRDGQSLMAMLARALPRDMISTTTSRIVSVSVLAAAFIAFDLAHSAATGEHTGVTDFLAKLGTVVSTQDPHHDSQAESFLQAPAVVDETIMAAAHDAAAAATAAATPADVAASLEAALKLIAAVTASVSDYLDQSAPAHATTVAPVHVTDTTTVVDDSSSHQAPPPAPEKAVSIQVDPSMDHAEVVEILQSIVNLSNLQALGQAVTVPAAPVETVNVALETPAAVDNTDTTSTPVAAENTEPAATATPSGYVVHQAAPVTQFHDGQVDVFVYTGQAARIENFNLGEDFIAVGGNTSDTSWIREINFSGNDVKIVGVNGSVLWLDGALAPHAHG